jgi:hypothetical protein
LLIKKWWHARDQISAKLCDVEAQLEAIKADKDKVNGLHIFDAH